MRIVIAVACAVILLFASCKKASLIEQDKQNLLEQYFEQNILNNDFIVSKATDDANDLTAQYNGYKFRLLKNTLLAGPMTATKAGVVLNGTWSSNDDYSKLVITLPYPVPAEFGFLNREWRFTKKALPTMELAPWGSTEAKVLHMQRQ